MDGEDKFAVEVRQFPEVWKVRRKLHTLMFVQQPQMCALKLKLIDIYLDSKVIKDNSTKHTLNDC